VSVVVRSPTLKNLVTTISPSELTSELTSTGPDTENIQASDSNADEEQPRVPSIEGSEPPTDLENTIKKKSKGKPNVRKAIEDLKQGDDDDDSESSHQETPVIVRTKRLRTEAVRVLPYLRSWKMD
jgi:hypothetical protein